MTDSSSKANSFSRLVSPSSPQSDDRGPAAARWHRRLASMFRPSVESNVVALVCSAFATVVAILLAVSVYWLHDRVRVLELHCTTRPSQWTENASGRVIDQVYINTQHINYSAYSAYRRKYRTKFLKIEDIYRTNYRHSISKCVDIKRATHQDGNTMRSEHQFIILHCVTFRHCCSCTCLELKISVSEHFFPIMCFFHFILSFISIQADPTRVRWTH